ncbi:MAG: OmpA family protein [Bacteroidota bacterium]|nr:OmpA family protein [Candidatus Kapabacteria bacterium]MDW8221182.1 OmpA family protein [Bacteroidota bacterium]
MRLGVYGQYAYNMHRAAFANLPGVPTCCPAFTDAVSHSYAIGALWDIPFSNSVGISLRLGYTPTPAPFFTEDTRFLLLNTAGVPIIGRTHHILTANMGSAGLEGLITIKPLNTDVQRRDDGLTIMLGVRAGYTFHSEFRQYEYMPIDTVQFADERGQSIGRIRGDTVGAIPSLNPYGVSLVGGISWEIPLNTKRTVYLAPEVLYSFPLLPVIRQDAWNGAWSVHQLRVGVSLKFAPEYPSADTTVQRNRQQEPQSDVPTFTVSRERISTHQIERAYAAQITATGVERDGTEVTDVRFRVEEFLSTNLRPLLPYVFFAQGSDNIPERYERLSKRDVDSFLVDKLHNYEVLETYHHIMNILGHRMRRYPLAKLTITGCNDNTSAGERGNMALSYRRAKAVRDYLANTWGIDTMRMPIQIRNLPAMPTVSSTGQYDNEVMQENRRVEFSSDTWEILEPIKTQDTVRVISPPILRLRPRVSLPQGSVVREWRMTIQQQGAVLKEFRGTSVIPPIVDWNIAERQATIPQASAPLEYTLTVTDASGSQLSAYGAIPVEQMTIQRKRRERLRDREVDRYSLILFDFDKSNLTPTHQRIAAFIKQQISNNATVRISGYTDYTNPLDYSLRLSKARARETALALDVAKRAEIRGLGKTILLYDTDLPEGRFYCRTVTIVVETPIDRNERQ